MQTENHNDIAHHMLEWPLSKRQEIAFDEDVEKRERLCALLVGI